MALRADMAPTLGLVCHAVSSRYAACLGEFCSTIDSDVSSSKWKFTFKAAHESCRANKLRLSMARRDTEATLQSRACLVQRTIL
jgi:hypothetical protein